MKIKWIDMVKVTGTFAVILGHISSPLGAFIFSWHMPLFFICSGFITKNSSDLTLEIKKNFQRLIVPYFIFCLIGLVATFSKSILLSRLLDYESELLAIFFWADMPALSNSYAFVLWFLPTLFFAKIWFLAINRHVRTDFVKLLLAVSLFLIGVNNQLPFSLDESFTALPWLFIGSKLFNLLNTENKPSALPLLFAMIVIALVYQFYGTPRLDIASKVYEDYYIANFAWGVAIVYILCFVYRVVDFESGLLLGYLSTASLLMYTIHPYTNNISYLVVEYFGLGSLWFLKFLLSVLMLLPVIIARNKYSESKVFNYV